MDPSVFSPDHIPTKLAGREKQAERLTSLLNSSAGPGMPVRAWLHGRTGTGKTVTARSVADSHAVTNMASSIYVDCCENRSAYSVLDTMLTQMRALCAETPQLAYKSQRLRQAVKETPCVAVIDSIDCMAAQERDTCLRILADTTGLHLLCISETEEPFTELKEQTANRIRPVFIEFPEYDTGTLRDILLQRCATGLNPGSWSHELVSEVSRMSGGDARVAIQMLRSAAHMADCEVTGFIEKRHVETGHEKAQTLKREQKLRHLGIHHRMMYEIVRKRGRIGTRRLAKEYRKLCTERKVAPVARRSFYRYIDAMQRLRLLRGERTRGFGSVTNLEVVE